MFEEQRNWLKNFHRPSATAGAEPPAAPQSAPVTKQLAPAAPHSAQWPAAPDPSLPPELAMRQMVIIGEIPTPQQMFAGTAETPLPNREIPLAEYKDSAEDMYLQVHAEVNVAQATDRLYNPKIGGRDYSQEFISAMKDANEWQNMVHKSSQDHKASTLVATTMDCGDGVVINYDATGSSISLSAPGGWVSIPRSAIDALISALQTARSAGGGKSRSAPEHPVFNSEHWGYATAARGRRLGDL